MLSIIQLADPRSKTAEPGHFGRSRVFASAKTGSAQNVNYFGQPMAQQYQVYISKQNMKRSVLVNKSYQGFVEKPELFDIPKCQNRQQFFTLTNAKRKKKNSSLTFSMAITPFKAQQSLIPQSIRNSAYSEKGPAINDALTSVTDSSSTTENAICFKNKQAKQRVNKMESLENNKVQSDFWKKRVSSPRAPILNWEKPKQLGHAKKKWAVDDFVFVRKIGEGSYSKVYLAIEKRANFVCSVKMISKKSIKSEKLLHVVIRQLKIHHYLEHRNIVALYGEFDDQQNLYLITQFCTDGDLHKYVKEKQRLGEEFDILEVSQIVRQICEAVAIMHRDCLMHRDIKPENIFLTMGKFVKLGDFGWSVYYGDHGLRNTQCGTPLYLAPELVEHNQYSETVDIWAIGVLAYELLTGQIPFKIRGTKDLAKIVNENIKFQYIEDELARDFVMKLLERDVKLRMEIEDVLEHPFLHIEEHD